MQSSKTEYGLTKNETTVPLGLCWEPPNIFWFANCVSVSSYSLFISISLSIRFKFPGNFQGKMWLVYVALTVLLRPKGLLFEEDCLLREGGIQQLYSELMGRVMVLLCPALHVSYCSGIRFNGHSVAENFRIQSVWYKVKLYIWSTFSRIQQSGEDGQRV